MKITANFFVFCALSLKISTLSAQCPIPNKDFDGYWIASTLINFSELFDPQDWSCTRVTGENAINFYESGLYPAPASIGGTAVEFNLEGPPVETGIWTLKPIVCTQFPQQITGRFKHSGTTSDTLYFILNYSTVDGAGGDTIREIRRAALVCQNHVMSAFQEFSIPVELPHLNVYTQIDTLQIVYKNQSANPGIYYLDMVDFGYTTAANTAHLVENLCITPNITSNSATVVLPESGFDLRLIGPSGQVIRSEKAVPGTRYELDLSALPAGLYYVTASDADQGVRMAGKLLKR